MQPRTLRNVGSVSCSACNRVPLALRVEELKVAAYGELKIAAYGERQRQSQNFQILQV